VEIADHLHCNQSGYQQTAQNDGGPDCWKRLVAFSARWLDLGLDRIGISAQHPEAQVQKSKHISNKIHILLS
jgi:hypothetical protein